MNSFAPTFGGSQTELKAMHQAAHSTAKLLSPPVVIDRTSLSRTTLWRMVRRGEFPKPIQVSPGRIAWPEPAVSEWIASKLGAA